MENLSLEIRKKREELGLSQEDLADMLGISQSWLSRIETGDPAFCRKYRGSVQIVLSNLDKLSGNPRKSDRQMAVERIVTELDKLNVDQCRFVLTVVREYVKSLKGDNQ